LEGLIDVLEGLIDVLEGLIDEIVGENGVTDSFLIFWK
jgi:hypothetical protein